jgi:hypothetical protein
MRHSSYMALACLVLCAAATAPAGDDSAWLAPVEKAAAGVVVTDTPNIAEGRALVRLRAVYGGLLQQHAGTPTEARIMAHAMHARVFHAPYQYPACYNSAIRARKPVYSGREYPALVAAKRALEDATARIRAEYDAFPRADHNANVEELTLNNSRWDSVQVFVSGTCLRPRAFGGTCAVLAALGARLDEMHPSPSPMLWSARFNRFEPYIKVMPHKSSQNQRLKLHLGIHVPPGVHLDIANTTGHWEEGRCLVLDDSFRHSIDGQNAAARVVLEVEIRHPEIFAPVAAAAGEGGSGAGAGGGSGVRVPFLWSNGGRDCAVMFHGNQTMAADRVHDVARRESGADPEKAGKVKQCGVAYRRLCAARIAAKREPVTECNKCAMDHFEPLSLEGCEIAYVYAECDAIVAELLPDRVFDDDESDTRTESEGVGDERVDDERDDEGQQEEL